VEVSYDPNEPSNLSTEFPPLSPNLTHVFPIPALVEPQYVNGGYGLPPARTHNNNSRAFNIPTAGRPSIHGGAGRGRGRGTGRPTPELTHRTIDPATATDPGEASLEEIIAKAVEASTTKLKAELNKTRKKFLQIDAKFNELQQIITDNAKKIAAATSEATIAALTGDTSPFLTKDDNLKNQEQQLQVQTKIADMQASIDRLITAFTTHSRANPYTPPRAHKVSKRDHSPPDELPADSNTPTYQDMEEDVRVGEH
jgi:hypothetical protein